MSLIAGGQTARAQDASSNAASRDTTTVGEVMVTATKRQERLRDVPVAASVVNNAMLEQRGLVADPGQLLQAIPGVRFNNPGSPGTSEISIRGSGTARATSADSGVGLYRNGMYLAAGLSLGRNFLRADLFDIERAEVLRGTLGALYGRNAVGGAINLISAQPVFEQTGTAMADYNATKEGITLQAVENIPVSDKIAVRLGVDYVDQNEGFFFNRSFNQDFDQYHGFVVRGQIRYKDGPIDATLLVEQQELRIPPVTPQLSIQPTPPQFPRGYAVPQYAYDSDILSRSHQDVKDIVFNGSYDFDWSKLSLSLGYRDRSADSYIDGDGFTAATLAATRAAGNPAGNIDPGDTQVAIDRTQTYYAETHLAGEYESFQWLAGAEYLRATSDFRFDRFRTPTAVNRSIGATSFTAQIWTSWATYASVGYNFSEDLKVTGELRYTEDRKRAVALRWDTGTRAVLAPPINRDVSFSNTSYNLIASYRFASNVMTYAKVGTGYRVGGFNAVPGDPRQPIPVPFGYGNEKSTTYEVGAKGNIVRSIFVSAAGYHTKISDVLALQNNGCAPANPVCPTAPINFVANAGQGSIYGVEVELNGRWELVGGDLTLQAGASRQYGKFTAGPLKGIRVPQTPSWLANANLDYTHPLAAGWSWFGNANVTAQWGGLQDVNRPPFFIDDRTLVDLRGGIRKGGVEVAAYVKNVGDDVYRIFATATTNRWPDDRRNWGVQLRYRW